MKLVTLTCPNCNAQLQINMELKQAVCNFCGHQFLIDDERQKVDLNIVNPKVLGEAIEYSRRNVRGGNKELAEEVGAMIEPLCTVNDLSRRVDLLEKRVNYGRKQIELYEQPLMKYLHFIAPPAFFICSFIFFLLCDSDVLGSLSICLFLTVCLFIGLIIAKISIQSSYKTSVASLERLSPELETARESLAGMDIDLIPPKYRDKESMNYIYDALLNQRAMNVQEAIELYEDEKYKKKMEDIEKKKIQEIQRLNRTVKASANKPRKVKGTIHVKVKRR